MQQINKKTRGLSETQICICAVKYCLITRNKKFYLIIIRMRVLCTTLWDYWSLRPVIHTPYAVSVGMSRGKVPRVIDSVPAE